ncbi:uncharacterized protein LOC130729546 [Lotus japonicus]|uniref:uncharacterized protein LOC130729546 n=1 Tax=Lotus japonicus TaxID=34305 RepID=UPI0025830A4B|nr:uncharacterized protein LOC130729546 [Lotus japonicus]
MNYMISNDLALKGIFNGFELIIFPSNILPEKSQLWNQRLFLWGVFKAQKQRNGDIVKRGAIYVNAYPECDNAGVGEIRSSDARPGFAVVGVNLAVQGRSTTSESSYVRIEHHVKELPKSLSPAPPSTQENMDPLDWHIAETFILLSRGKF